MHDVWMLKLVSYNMHGMQHDATSHKDTVLEKSSFIIKSFIIWM